MNKRRLLFRAATVLVLIAIAACMMVVGRGHTVYFDNKTLEYEGQTWKAPYRVNVYQKGENIAKLAARERGMTTNIGQSIDFAVGVIQEKGGEEEFTEIALRLPYGMDGIIVNIPGYLAGLPQEAWMTEFIATPTEEELQEEAPSEEEDLLAGAEF